MNKIIIVNYENNCLKIILIIKQIYLFKSKFFFYYNIRKKINEINRKSKD